MVGERSVSLRRCTARYAGDIRNEDAGMSNDKWSLESPPPKV